MEVPDEFRRFDIYRIFHNNNKITSFPASQSSGTLILYLSVNDRCYISESPHDICPLKEVILFGGSSYQLFWLGYQLIATGRLRSEIWMNVCATSCLSKRYTSVVQMGASFETKHEGWLSGFAKTDELTRAVEIFSADGIALSFYS